MDKENPLVTVSTLLWHSEKFVKNCLSSLFAQTHHNFELLIADNNSSDRGPEIARKIIGENIGQRHWKFTSYGQNIGFAAGHNRHIAEAKGKYVFLLNTDVILAENFLAEAVKVLEQNDKCAAVQPRCLRLKEINGVFEKTDIIDNFGLVILKNRRIIGRGQGQPAKDKFLKEEEVFGADGAAPVYRQEALDDIKICVNQQCEYLDEDFLSYKEDVDLAWRLRLAGWRTIYAPQVIAWHVRGSGDSAKKNFIGIIKERQNINDFAKKLSFTNQRPMQLKNEQPILLLKHLPWFLPKEIAAWLYFLIFEWRNRGAIKQTFKLMPKMIKKRKIIMARKRVSAKEMEKWFE